MAINLLVGRKNKDGSVDSITVRRDGGLDHNKLLYKYYRSPERVDALIKNGSNYSCLARYISQDELNPNSPLHNEEVTMLPIDIGFPEKDFYKYMNESRSTHTTYQDPSVEAFFADAQNVGFYDDDVYLYDPETENWSVGASRKPIREHILGEWQEQYDEDPEWVSETLEELNSKMDAIDKFIAARKQQTPALSEKSAPEQVDSNEKEELPHMLKGVDLYLKVVEQIGYSDRPRRIYFLPITQEIENMKVSEIPGYLGIENATVEIYHGMRENNNVSSAYLSTWIPFAQETPVIKYTIFSLLEAIENNNSMQRTMKTSGHHFSPENRRKVLAELELKERLAANVLSKVIDEETLKIAADRVRELYSPVGIYEIIEDLGILNKQKDTGKKM